jgi:hypothetical protein
LYSVIPRRFVLTLLAALAVLGASSPTEAAPRRRHPRPISAITLTPEGSGTLIRVTYGRVHPCTRVLRSHEPIDAVAVVDVDADGDQDIVAVRESGDLVLWRHGGRGRFIVVAAAPDRTPVTRRHRAFHRVHDTTAPIQSSDERYSAAMPRAPNAVVELVETQYIARASSLVLSAPCACFQGRAPPAIA